MNTPNSNDLLREVLNSALSALGHEAPKDPSTQVNETAKKVLSEEEAKQSWRTPSQVTPSHAPDAVTPKPEHLHINLPNKSGSGIVREFSGAIGDSQFHMTVWITPGS